MSEYKQVLYDLRTTYNGPFVVEDFYAEVDNWIREKGYKKEPKKKMEHVAKGSRKIDYVIEAHTHLDDLHHGTVILRAMMDNVKEVVVKNGNKKVRINNGDVFIDINGFIEGHAQGSFYHTKPMYTLIRTLIDKYIYNIWSDKYDGKVNSDGRDLFKRIRSFFELQKYKYG